MKQSFLRESFLRLCREVSTLNLEPGDKASLKSPQTSFMEGFLAKSMFLASTELGISTGSSVVLIKQDMALAILAQWIECLPVD